MAKAQKNITALEGTLKEDKLLPSVFKIGRGYGFQSKAVERTLFSDMMEKEEATFIVSQLPQKVSELDLATYIYAIERLLYNQSVLSGNSGNVGVKGIQAAQLNSNGFPDYESGTIVATLNDICKYAYGVEKPTTEHKKRMQAIIHAVDRNFASVEYTNKRGERKRLSIKLVGIWTKEETLTERGGRKNAPIKYALQVNPIFSKNLETQYGLLPQNAMPLLTEALKARKQRKTYGHIKLMKYLALQDKRKSITRSLAMLLDELGMMDDYKVHRQRTLSSLANIFQSLVDIGQLQKLPTKGTAPDGAIAYTFHLSPDFGKEETPEAPEVAEVAEELP